MWRHNLERQSDIVIYDHMFLKQLQVWLNSHQGQHIILNNQLIIENLRVQIQVVMANSAFLPFAIDIYFTDWILRNLRNIEGSFNDFQSNWNRNPKAGIF
jgi:hypothetical protein